ncbi:type II secretion system F family protein, partial [Klebsiella pneumoniae]|nr:type II secretion system F family protein [Klebsiella pneumoniae]
MGGELPWLSGVLLRTGRAVGAHPWGALLGLVAVAAAVVGMVRHPAVRAALGRWLWQAPVIGERLRLIELASLYRTLGLLLQAGVAVV